MNFIFTSLLNNWRTGKKGAKHTSLLAAILMLSLPALLTGCSGGDAPPAGASSTASTTIDGYSLYINTSQNSIKTDAADKATITATVAKNSIRQADVVVSFATTGGLLSYPNEVTTNADGEASITLQSGPKTSNQLISVSAECSGATNSVPVQITGNTLALSIPQSNLAIGGKDQTLTATLQNAVPLGIADATIKFAVEEGAGVVSFSSSTGTTNYAGTATITVRGERAGTATITAEGMGVISRIKVNVSNQAFEITDPIEQIDPNDPTAPPAPAELATNGELLVKVKAPAPASTVIFHTTIGVWNSVDNEEEVPVIDGFATAKLTSPSAAGMASVTVYDKTMTSNQDSLKVKIYAPASEAYNVSLQASQANVAVTPSDATSKNSVTLTATVVNINNFPVGGGVVNFTLSDIAGGGEYLSTSMATTDSTGVATCTFYSGSLGSIGTGVKITATVAKSGNTDSVNITIRDLAGSIVMGRANKVSSDSSNTYYTQKITAQVSDANGNSVPNAIVSLNLWPTDYYLGAEAHSSTGSCVGYFYNSWPEMCAGQYAQKNEDINKNLTLDAGEDFGPFDLNRGTMYPDGFLTPSNSTAGSVPATVTTDANGVATFEITYLKQYAMWVGVELTATVKVQGTETQAKMNWVLVAIEEEYDACDLFASPFGYFAETCYGNIFVTVKDQTTNKAIAGAIAFDELDNSCTTNASGQCTITGVSAGQHSVNATATGYQSNIFGTEITVIANTTVPASVLLTPSP